MNKMLTDAADTMQAELDRAIKLYQKACRLGTHDSGEAYAYLRSLAVNASELVKTQDRIQREVEKDEREATKATGKAPVGSAQQKPSGKNGPVLTIKQPKASSPAGKIVAAAQARAAQKQAAKPPAGKTDKLVAELAKQAAQQEAAA